MNDYFSDTLATFWLGIEQCFNRGRNLVGLQDESGHFCMTHVGLPETGARKESIYGAGFWRVCHDYK